MPIPIPPTPPPPPAITIEAAKDAKTRIITAPSFPFQNDDNVLEPPLPYSPKPDEPDNTDDSEE